MLEDISIGYSVAHSRMEEWQLANIFLIRHDMAIFDCIRFIKVASEANDQENLMEEITRAFKAIVNLSSMRKL